MATKKYGYNQYKPDGPAGMDIVDQELNRYSPAFDYLSGFVTRSQLKQVDDERTGTSPTTPTPTTPTPTTPTPTTPTPTTPTPTTPTPTTPTPTTPTPTTPTTPPPPPRFSSEFETEEDAKNYINQYYRDTLGRDAKFDSSDGKDASYWLRNFVSGADTKDSFESNVKLGDEYQNRLKTVDLYRDLKGGDPTEQELDAIVNPGGSLSSVGNTASTEFLSDYASKIAAGDDTATVDSRVTGDANRNFVDQSDLTTGDLKSTTTQGSTTSTIDQAIRDAYKNVLGRDADQEGYNYWAKTLRDNPTFDLASSFKESPEYKLRNPS